MSTDNQYVAIFLGNQTSPRAKAFFGLPEAERTAKEKEGIAAWGAWMEKHKASIVHTGGPLGKTKKISPDGIADATNAIGGFVIVRAPSHEAAAKMFEKHPQFTIFPGESVEVMPVMPIPGM